MSVVCSKEGQWDAIKILLGTISITLKFNLYMEVMISIQDGAAGSTDRLSLNLNGLGASLLIKKLLFKKDKPRSSNHYLE